MKYKQQFGGRSQFLAIHPKALDIMFETTEIKDNCEDEGIAIVSICGPLEHHYSWMFDSYDAIIERLEEAFSSDAHCVVMCIDSPGGDASGSTEAHRQIQALKKKYDKKLYAYSNESMYSAAYSIGSTADEIWVPETGGVGSVGVICSLLDKTKQNEQLGLNIKLLTTGARKADTQADREMTDDVVNSMQSRVDYLGGVFFRSVAKARGISPKAVRKLEAGVFMGEEAVSAKLADGVAGWFDFLEYVKGSVTGKIDESKSAEKSNMKTLSQLKKDRAEIAKKLLDAKSNDERKKLFASYETASTELAEFQAKTKYVKKTEERLTEEDDEDDDSDAEESEESDESEESEDDSDAEESEESEEEETVAEKAKNKKMKQTSSLSLKSIDKLVKTAAKLTGKVDISEICGALDGMVSRVGRADKVEARLQKIETDTRRTRVKSLLDEAQKDGRVTPAQAKGLFEQGLKDSKWLKGYLSSQPKQARDLSLPDPDGLPETIESTTLTRDQEKMLSQAAHSAGMTVEQYKEQLAKFSKPKQNGVLPRT